MESTLTTGSPPRIRAASVRGLTVYQQAFTLQQEVFRASRTFPKEEAYSLTHQLRRASRSIGANLTEAWAKRRYPAHFASKLTDADAELQECIHWLETARACDYLAADAFTNPRDRYLRVGRSLGAMIKQADSFCR